MSTDASGFSLENAEKVLKPHLKYLPFKRLGDYMTNLDLKEKIRGKTFHLQLWEGNTRLPGGFYHGWKAYGVLVGSDIIMPAGMVEPIRIEHTRLIILCPADAIIWALQKIKFIPERASDSYYVGSSEIWRANDDNLRGLGADFRNVKELFWAGIMQWGMQSNEDRKKASENVDALITCCSQNILEEKPAVRIVKR